MESTNSQEMIEILGTSSAYNTRVRKNWTGQKIAIAAVAGFLLLNAVGFGVGFVVNHFFMRMVDESANFPISPTQSNLTGGRTTSTHKTTPLATGPH